MKISRQTRKARSGFTMVEILAVVAIIGILAGVLAPTIATAFRKVAQNTASSNLRQIIQAYNAYGSIITNNSSGGDSSAKNGIATDVATFAEVLAANKQLESGLVWYVEQDDKRPAEIPKTVLQDNTNQLKANKSTAWAVVVNAKASRKNKESYPLIWTRGLLTSGEWDKENGVWGDEGGHIAFWDGHVKWVSNTTKREDKFIKADNTNSPTISYQEAIAGSSSSSSESQPIVYEDK